MSRTVNNEQALVMFQERLAFSLADELGCPVRAVEEVVAEVTADWSVEHQVMRPVTDPHKRFMIHTPWAGLKTEGDTR